MYKYCSPTRSSFLTGRLPVHVNQDNQCNDASSTSGADLRMTLLPEKLRLAGYETAAVGKWVNTFAIMGILFILYCTERTIACR